MLWRYGLVVHLPVFVFALKVETCNSFRFVSTHQEYSQDRYAYLSGHEYHLEIHFSNTMKKSIGIQQKYYEDPISGERK